MLQILIWLICFALIVWATGLFIRISGTESEDNPNSKKATERASILLYVTFLAAAFFAWLAYEQGEEISSTVRSIPGF